MLKITNNGNKRFTPNMGTTVNFLGSVCLIFILKKGSAFIKEIWSHWACVGVTRF
jgi:hypothetical protein